MGTVVHTSRIVITREKGPTRKAVIGGFAAMSVKGAIAIEDSAEITELEDIR